MLRHSWEPPAGFRIIQASANLAQVLLGLSGGHLVYLELNQSQELVQVSDTNVEYEISCVDISPLESVQAVANVCVIGLWGEGGVRVLRIPNWNVVAAESLGDGTYVSSCSRFATGYLYVKSPKKR